jgi:hypothetical protein
MFRHPTRANIIPQTAEGKRLIFRCQNFGSKNPGTDAESAQFRCQFAAKKTGIFALFAAFPCSSVQTNKKPAKLAFKRIRGLLRVATLTGFEPVLPP